MLYDIQKPGTKHLNRFKSFIHIFIVAFFFPAFLLGQHATTSNATSVGASNGKFNDAFGFSVSTSGTFTAIGAPFDDDNGADAGAVYIFEYTGSDWVEQTKITGSDGAQSDRFGYAVAISGSYLIVGAYLDDDNANNSGSAYIFQYDGSGWNEQTKLHANSPGADHFFGTSVALDGDYAIVGASEATNDNAVGTGRAYVFKRSGVAWNQEAVLQASDAAQHDAFGSSVALDGNWAIIGASSKNVNGPKSGAAYIFRNTGGAFKFLHFCNKIWKLCLFFCPN